jgi:hypothetical protein
MYTINILVLLHVILRFRKSVSVTYNAWVSVALFIQHAKGYHHNLFIYLASPTLQHFFSISQETTKFSVKIFEQKCLFFIKFQPRNFSDEIQVDWTSNLSTIILSFIFCQVSKQLHRQNLILCKAQFCLKLPLRFSFDILQFLGICSV